jgi:hypothetical protein
VFGPGKCQAGNPISITGLDGLRIGHGWPPF